MSIVKWCMFATQYPMVPMTNPTTSMDPSLSNRTFEGCSSIIMSKPSKPQLSYLITLHYMTLHYIISYCITSHHIIYCTMLRYIMSYHIISYYIILYYIILYYIVLYYIILYYIILYHIILYYTILCVSLTSSNYIPWYGNIHWLLI